MSKDFRKLIQESVKQKQLHPEDIPSLDLYMDQVIALMSEHLGEDGEKEPLTRTMIHNYSKAGVISPIKGKKYSREQILQMLAVYSLKNLLSISQIKRILNGVEQSGAGDRLETVKIEMVAEELPEAFGKLLSHPAGAESQHQRTADGLH